MATLVLTTRRIDSSSSGYDLRVAGLCSQIAEDPHLVVIPPLAGQSRSAGIDASAIFDTVEEWPRPCCRAVPRSCGT